MSRQDVEFPTVDGLTLRGWLFPAKQRGPAIIVLPGFNCVKEMFVPDVAAYFQSAGITTLTFDPRTLGVSDGVPRNDIDPWKTAEDYHDALTFLKTQPTVEPDKICYWGFSFSGMVSLTAAALDKRAKLVIAVCPLTDFTFPKERWPKVLAMAQKDRESRLKGNDALVLPALTEAGENPTGWGGGTAKEDFNLILSAKTIAPNYRNETSIQTYYRISAWDPYKLMSLVSPTPVMLVTAENDQISLVKNQVKLFEMFDGEKHMEVVPNKTHMDALSGDDFERVMQLQVDFIKKHLDITQNGVH